MDESRGLPAQTDLFIFAKRMAEPKMTVIWKIPAIHAEMTLPNISEVGEALEISNSIARESFSAATLEATICPYMAMTVYSAMTMI